MKNKKSFYFSQPIPEDSQATPDPYLPELTLLHNDWRYNTDLSNFTKAHINQFLEDFSGESAMDPQDYISLDRFCRDTIEIINPKKEVDIAFWEVLLDLLMEIASKKLSSIITINLEGLYPHTSCIEFKDISV